MTDFVRVGVVGAGNISHNAHLPAYKSVTNAKVVAICDLDIERAKKAAEDFDIPHYYDSVTEMLANEDIDAVDICTWNNAHAPVAIEAANAGKHVICEKPLTVSVENAEKIAAAIKANGVKFMLAVPGRFGNKNQYIRKMLDSGELGEVYFGKTAYVRRRGTPYGWFTDKKTSGGGPIIDIGIHGIDAAWYLMGNPKPVRISAQISNRIGDYQTKGVDRWIGTKCPDNRFDTEDSGCGVIHFENGACLMFEASWAINGPAHSDTLICGTKAGVSLDPFKVYGERNGYLSDDAITMNDNNRFASELTHFYDCVLNDKEPIYPIEQAILMQKMLNGIYESAEKGKEVEIV